MGRHCINLLDKSGFYEPSQSGVERASWDNDLALRIGDDLIADAISMHGAIRDSEQNIESMSGERAIKGRYVHAGHYIDKLRISQMNGSGKP